MIENCELPVRTWYFEMLLYDFYNNKEFRQKNYSVNLRYKRVCFIISWAQFFMYNRELFYRL